MPKDKKHVPSEGVMAPGPGPCPDIIKRPAFSFALRAAKAAVWEWDEVTGETIWSENVWTLLGLPRDTKPSFDAFVSVLHPVDRVRVMSEWEALKGQRRFELELRIIAPDGSEHWLLDVGEGVDADAGRRWAGMLIDVTERKKTELLLRQSEDRYRVIVESQNDAVCRWRPDTTLTFANRFYLEMFAFSPEVIGRERWINRIPEEEKPRVQELIKRMLREKKPISYEHNVIRADGSLRWYLWVDVPLLGDDGECHEFQSVGRDITERVRTERTIKQLIEHVGQTTGSEFISSLIHHLCVSLDVDYAFFAEIRDGAWIDGEVHTADGKKPLHSSQEIGGRPCAAVLQGLCYSGDACQSGLCPISHVLDDSRCDLCVCVPIVDSSQAVIGIIGVGRAERVDDAEFLREMLQIFSFRIGAELERERHAREILRFTHELQRRVEQRTEQIQLQAIAMDNTMEGMAVLKDDLFVYTNQSFAAMFGYSPAELIGINRRLLFNPGLVNRTEQVVMPTPVPEGSLRGEMMGLRKDGRVFDIEISFACAPGGHVICNCRDITLAKTTERELLRKSAELERATRLKDEFLASMSHELRTPLAGILGLSEVLRDGLYGEISDPQIDAIRSIEDCGRHLLELINDILDLAKIESGKAELDEQPTSLPVLASACIRMVRSAASRKNISINLHVEPPDFSAVLDTRRCKQIVINLLDNAIKFTPKGGRVDLSVTTTADRKNIEFKIKDNGCGIDASNIRRIFQPFEQVDRNLSREYEGAGLGLPLVLRLTELHDGGVSVDSQPGKGSIFTVTIPWRKSGREVDGNVRGQEPLPPHSIQSGTGKPPPRVLIIEDNRITSRVLFDYLTRNGMSCHMVTESPKAMTECLTFKPDVILMDIQMPVIDGFELTAVIRACGDRNLESIPIIALTALAMPGDRERCLKSGMNDYMVKPYRLVEVHETVLKQLGYQLPTVPD